MQTVYINLSELNELQTRIAKFVGEWVHQKKTQVPLKEIIATMKQEGVIEATTIKSIGVLIRKGYIRRSYHPSNKTYFTQLRTI